MSRKMNSAEKAIFLEYPTAVYVTKKYKTFNNRPEL
jgi:hypothetical protein